MATPQSLKSPVPTAFSPWNIPSTPRPNRSLHLSHKWTSGLFVSHGLPQPQTQGQLCPHLWTRNERQLPASQVACPQHHKQATDASVQAALHMRLAR